MTWLLLESASTLVWCMSTLRFRGLPAVFSKLKRVETTKGIEPTPIDLVCHSVANAAVFLPLRLSPFDRAAALTVMLRRHGWAARFVVGVQILPFEDHAWVELDSYVISDSQDVRDIYQVLAHS